MSYFISKKVGHHWELEKIKDLFQCFSSEENIRAFIVLNQKAYLAFEHGMYIIIEDVPLADGEWIYHSDIFDIFELVRDRTLSAYHGMLENHLDDREEHHSNEIIFDHIDVIFKIVHLRSFSRPETIYVSEIGPFFIYFISKTKVFLRDPEGGK